MEFTPPDLVRPDGASDMWMTMVSLVLLVLMTAIGIRFRQHAKSWWALRQLDCPPYQPFLGNLQHVRSGAVTMLWCANV